MHIIPNNTTETKLNTNTNKYSDFIFLRHNVTFLSRVINNDAIKVNNRENEINNLIIKEIDTHVPIKNNKTMGWKNTRRGKTKGIS